MKKDKGVIIYTKQLKNGDKISFDAKGLNEITDVMFSKTGIFLEFIIPVIVVGGLIGGILLLGWICTLLGY